MEPSLLDSRFRQAVAAIDAGDQPALKDLLRRYPELATERLTAPGPWLRDKVDDALDRFFRDPYLLWFIAEDPVRSGALPANIVDLAETIIKAARIPPATRLPEQLDTALRLVAWSWIARDAGVQIGLIDLLLDAGASVDGSTLYQGRFGTNVDAAIYNGNLEAAEHLLGRGATLSFTAALCLGRWDDVARLAPATSAPAQRAAFVQAALHGNAEALRRMLALGMPPTTVSEHLQAHGTALHHAVWSGRLEAVRVLVEAGAELNRRDTIHDGTPLGWALYAGKEQADPERARRYAETAEFLKSRGAEE